MTDAQKIAEEIQQALAHAKCGALRFWGVWFGRPSDNFHKIVSSEHERDVLRMHFDQGERPTVCHPKELKVDPSIFQMGHAERVLGEWFYYGRPKTDANIFLFGFVRTGEAVIASSNVNQFTPNLKTDAALPAAEIW